MSIKNEWDKAQSQEKLSWIKISSISKKPAKKLWEKLLASFENRLKLLTSASTILDVGCGPDGLIFYMPRGLRIGLDPLITSYKQHYTLSKDVSLIKAIGEEIPIRSGGVDLVLCINTLDHVINPFRLLKEMYDTTKEDGTLFIDVNTEPILDKQIRHLVGYKPPFNEFHPHKFSSKTVIDMLDEMGFKLDVIKLYPPLNSANLLLYLSFIIRGIFHFRKGYNEMVFHVPVKTALLFLLLRFIDTVFFAVISKDNFADRILIVAHKASVGRDYTE